MTPRRPQTPRVRPARGPSPGAAGAFLAVSAAMTLAVLVQAAMAGQAQFKGFDILVHGYVGNGTFALGAVALGLALVGRLPLIPTALATAVLAGLFAQTGLGYVGRESATAAAVHIPVGVAIFGLLCLQVAAAAQLRRDLRSRTPPARADGARTPTI